MDNRAALGFTLENYPDNLLLGRGPMWAYKILHNQVSITAPDEVEESMFLRLHSTHNQNHVQICFSGTRHFNLVNTTENQKLVCLLSLLRWSVNVTA